MHSVKDLCELLGDRLTAVAQWYGAMGLAREHGGRRFEELSMGELSVLWAQKIGELLYGRSCIGAERQAEIVRGAARFMEEFIGLRNRLFASLAAQYAELSAQDKEGLLTRAAWRSINTAAASPKGGYRLQVGLRTRGCQYRANDRFRRGCYNCGFFAGAAPGLEPSAEQIVTQFANAVELVEERVKARLVPPYDVIEFPNDGSFLNSAEVPEAAVQEIFRRIAQHPRVSRAMIETRPEYLRLEQVESILSLLRSDQTVQIGVGLETTDPFIATFSIHKGYAPEDYEDVVRLLSCSERCEVFAYAILKPAYVGELEAIEDAVCSARFVSRVGRQHAVPSMIKYEPAVVSRGTLLEVLYDSFDASGARCYEPPSYWSIAEVIARLFQEGLHGLVRVGAREDMDILRALPAIYHPNGMLSRFDFVLYDAIQQFNTHHDIHVLLLSIADVFADHSYLEWKRRTGLRIPEVEHLFERMHAQCERVRRSPAQRQRKAFCDRLFQVLDQVEYGKDSQRFLRQIVRPGSGEDWRSPVRDMVQRMLEEALGDVGVEVTNLQRFDDELGLVRMEVDLYQRSLGSYHSVWVNIPSSRPVPLEEVI